MGVQNRSSSMPYTPLPLLGQAHPPQLSASGLARLTESYKGDSNDLYDPENPGDGSDDEENLVIDDQKEDTENTSFPEEVPAANLQEKEPKDTDAEIPLCHSNEGSSNTASNIKIMIKTTSSTIGASKLHKKSPSPESLETGPSNIGGNQKKKSIIKDIFGSDEESGEIKKHVVVDAAIISSIAENLAEEREKFEVGKKIALLEELRQEVEDYSDVSDREIDESREVRMKDLSVSPINSDQSESFEKAATLDGLNPEAISPEEDFTSLSEEEEGEIKNYEKRKKLRLRKRELQKKVRELERQVIEISPNRGPLDISGLVLEEGEIHEDEKKKKKKLKEKAKGKKKINKKNKLMKGADPEKSSEAVPEQEVATTKEVEDDKENIDRTEKDVEAETEKTVRTRNYRKKSTENVEEKDGFSPEMKSSKKDKRKKEKPKKPELQRYDVRRLLDAKKERMEKLKAMDPDPESLPAEVMDPTKDKFGRDLEKKEKIMKRKPSGSRSRSRGRKSVKKARKRSSSVSSSSSRSRSRKRKSKTRKDSKKSKKIVLKKKLPVAEKIKKKIRSRSRSKNKKRRKDSKSKSRSRSSSSSNRKKKVKCKE